MYFILCSIYSTQTDGQSTKTEEQFDECRFLYFYLSFNSYKYEIWSAYGKYPRGLIEYDEKINISAFFSSQSSCLLRALKANYSNNNFIANLW